jgi:hypothetical protein
MIKTPLTPIFFLAICSSQFDFQARPSYLSLRNQLRHNPINRVDWNGKANTHRRSRRAIDLGIDNDQVSGARATNRLSFPD